MLIIKRNIIMIFAMKISGQRWTVIKQYDAKP